MQVLTATAERAAPTRLCTCKFEYLIAIILAHRKPVYEAKWQI